MTAYDRAPDLDSGHVGYNLDPRIAWATYYSKDGRRGLTLDWKGDQVSASIWDRKKAKDTVLWRMELLTQRDRDRAWDRLEGTSIIFDRYHGKPVTLNQDYTPPAQYRGDMTPVLPPETMKAGLLGIAFCEGAYPEWTFVFWEGGHDVAVPNAVITEIQLETTTP